MEVISVSDETFKVPAYLARQDVTLPAVLADYLKWDRCTKEEIKAYLTRWTAHIKVRV